jgi:hypothetical protein
MGEFNPYAPSKASMAARATASAVDSEARVWREGKTVVALQDASLPRRCVKCNEPADQPTKVRSLYWVHPALYLLLFGGALILLIVYFIVRKKADVDPGLCEKHKKRRLFALAYGWLGFFVGLGMLITVGTNDPAFIWLGLLLIISAIVVGMAMGRLVWAKKITKEDVRLGGFCKAYLEELPEYPG